MSGSSYGKIFKVTTWGESHGKGLGVVVDGVPAGIELSENDIQLFLNRRKPGQSKFTTPRKEDDAVEILSGVFEGKTTGTPVSMIVWNKNQNSKDYSEIASYYRPGHADFCFDEKYGFRDYRGGGRSSGRETIGRVAAGAIVGYVADGIFQNQEEVDKSGQPNARVGGLKYTCIAKMAMYVNKINGSALSDDLKHYIDPNDFNRVIYHQRSTDSDDRIKQLLTDADKLLALCESAYNDSTEYDLFVRCLSEQTIVENEKRRLRTKEDGGMKSSMMQNPSDPEATFRNKAGKEHRGYLPPCKGRFRQSSMWT